MTQCPKSIERSVRPVAFAVAIDAVGPPGEAVAAEVIGLVVAPADGALAGDHRCLLSLRAGNGVRHRIGNGQLRQSGTEKLLAVPCALVEIEQSEPASIAYGDSQPSWAVPEAEGQECWIVLALKQIGEPGVQDVRINPGIAGLVNLDQQRVEEQGHVVVAVVKCRPRTFPDAIAGGLAGQMPPGDLPVLELQIRVEIVQAWLPVGDGLVEALDDPLIEQEEQQVDQPGFESGSHVRAPGNVSPGINEITTTNDVAAAAHIIAQAIEFRGVQACLFGRLRGPGLAGEDTPLSRDF